MTEQELFLTCRSCGDLHPSQNTRTWRRNTYCVTCLDEFTFHCSNCRERYPNDDSEDGYCKDCYNNENGNGNGFHVLELPFTKLDSPTFNNNTFKQHIGIELECMNRNLEDNQFTYSDLQKYGFSQVEDGSLDNGGVEFPSLAFNGDLALEKIDAFCTELEKRRYYINAGCGYHVHIAVSKRAQTIKKIYAFYSKYEDFFFNMLPKSRQDSGYCYKLKKVFDNFSYDALKSAKDLHTVEKLVYNTNRKRTLQYNKRDKYNNKRYSWLNLHSIFYRGTLEIRSHSGTINPTKIKNWALIHLTVLNKLKRLSLERIEQLPQTEEFFLTLFSNDLQTYIKERWNTHKNNNVGETN